MATAATQGDQTTSAPPPPAPRAAGGAGARISHLPAFLGRWAVPLACIPLVALFSLLRPDTFGTTANFETILVTQAVLVVVTLGILFPLAAGEFDLSPAAVLGFTSTLVVNLTVIKGWATVPALALSLAVAIAIGLTNALFVVFFGVNSFVATIGMATFITGIATAVVGATTLGGPPNALTAPFHGDVLGIGLPVFYALALGLLIWYFLRFTPGGRHLFFTGEGREAARLAGVRVNRIRVGSFVMSAVLAWFAGLLLLGQTDASNATIGSAYLLPAYAAAFLGATTITPGRFNVWGAIAAVYLLEIGTTGLEMLGAANWISDVFNGASLVLAVTFARLASGEVEHRLRRRRPRRPAPGGA